MSTTSMLIRRLRHSAAALDAETLPWSSPIVGVFFFFCGPLRGLAELRRGDQPPTASQLEKLLPDPVLGMVPKMEGCLHAVRNGVTTARLASPLAGSSTLRSPLEIFTDEGTASIGARLTSKRSWMTNQELTAPPAGRARLANNGMAPSRPPPVRGEGLPAPGR